MAYDEDLAERVATALSKADATYETKKMMGGLCYMVDEKMCVGVERDRLMARIGPDAYEAALKREGCHVMDFTGKPMHGYVYVDLDALIQQQDVAYWISLALAFNPKAKRSKPRKKKT